MNTIKKDRLYEHNFNEKRLNKSWQISEHYLKLIVKYYDLCKDIMIYLKGMLLHFSTIKLLFVTVSS